MSDSQQTPAPPLPSAIPVICDKCRAEGMAGDEQFAAIPDILNFDPVPRRAHVNNWTPEHQRAFVAALAITGSPRQAARAIGRHAFGAEQLRKAKGGRSFNAACDAAMDIAKERELARIHANLKHLAEDPDRVPALAAEGSEEEGETWTGEAEEARRRIIRKVERIQREYLREIADDPEKRRAHELLNGPIPWDNIDSWSLGFEEEPGD
jgi:hypothetical protein